MKFNQLFFFELIQLPPHFCAEAFQLPGPLESDDENEEHHPRFITELSELVDSFKTAAAQDTSYRITLFQQALWTKSGHWLKMEDRTEGMEPDFSLGEMWLSTDSVVMMGKEKVALPHSKCVAMVALKQKKRTCDRDHFKATDHGKRLPVIQDRSAACTAPFQFVMTGQMFVGLKFPPKMKLKTDVGSCESRKSLKNQELLSRGHLVVLLLASCMQAERMKHCRIISFSVTAGNQGKTKMIFVAPPS